MSSISYSDVVRGARRDPRAQEQRPSHVVDTSSSSFASNSTNQQRPPPLAAFPPLGNRTTSSPTVQLQGHWTAARENPPALPATRTTTAASTTAMAPQDAVSAVEDFWVSPTAPQGTFSSSAPAPAAVPTVLGPNAGSWYQPKNADLILWCKGCHWEVHRSVLVSVSEWMEKYMPPPAEDGNPVAWVLDSWDVGVLGAVLQYIYLGDYEGGYYNPKKPLDTTPIINATATFLAGAAALLRPMMDHALTHIEAAAEAIQKLEATLRGSRLDEFESNIRCALLMMYDQADQWTIRALRIVMGKLLAVSFPLILQSPRWSRSYQQLWGILRVHVVVDHKWLSTAEQCRQSDVILAGFEHMDILWVKYRGKGWLPSDDLMFPGSEVANLPGPPVLPLEPARGKKKSKAIPIVRPDGTVAAAPSKKVVRGRGRGRGIDYSTGTVEPATSKAKAKEQEVKTPEQTPKKLVTKTGSSPAPKITTIVGSTGTATAIAADKDAQPGSAAWWAYISLQPYPALFPAPFFIRPPLQTWPGSPERNSAQPYCPGSYVGGPYFFPESSTGVPSKAVVAVGTGYSSSNEEFAAAPPKECSADTPSSPNRRVAELILGLGEPVAAKVPVAPAGIFDDHYSELCTGFDSFGVRASLGQESISHVGSLSTDSSTQSDDDLATPRAPTFDQTPSDSDVDDALPSPCAGFPSKNCSKGKQSY